MPRQDLKIVEPTRREALIAGGAAFGALAVGADFSRAAECILTSRQIDGPYHVANAPERRDVRSGKPGVDLLLRLKIVDAGNCKAIAGADTEIWSCDALGNYSGHPDVDPDVPPGGGGPPGGGANRGGRSPGGARAAGGRRGGPPQAGFPGFHREPTGPKRFLRGAQAADERGEVEFLTLYPGWYAPRAVHAHLKVRLGGNELLTTQLYFPDDLTDAIHRTEAYAPRRPTPYRNSDDRVKYWGTGGNEPIGVYPEMTTEGEMQVGTIVIGVKRA